MPVIQLHASLPSSTTIWKNRTLKHGDTAIPLELGRESSRCHSDLCRGYKTIALGTRTLTGREERHTPRLQEEGEESPRDSHLFDVSKVRGSVELQDDRSQGSRLYNASRVRDSAGLHEDCLLREDSPHLLDASRLRPSVELQRDSDETAGESDASDTTTCSNDTIRKLHAQAQSAEARARNAQARAQNAQVQAQNAAEEARKARDQYYRAKYSASRIRKSIELQEESSHISQPFSGRRIRSSPLGQRSRGSGATPSLEEQPGRNMRNDEKKKKKKKNRQRTLPDQKIPPAGETLLRSRRASRRSSTSELWCLDDHNKACKAR
ncbi:hypothetical protein HDV63DRAFT_331581 [Trichoderma sp. SZMC 28014]